MNIQAAVRRRFVVNGVEYAMDGKNHTMQAPMLFIANASTVVEVCLFLPIMAFKYM